MAKSELILAFNEIAEARNLPKDVIIDALKMALVSAYRRNAGISSMQSVEARIDERTGEPTVWVEKEVADEIHSEQTEVLLEEARELYPDAQIGDMVLVDDTPDGFGRIAAQTAKQVILQRMREAERDVQYQEFQDRVGDLVTGTVQSHSGDVITIGLGRTEAILPRSQQMPGERYRMHEKVRAYVMEVRRTNRGPQIVVSRTHRSMLRRLLEYEVPEIYNGTVEIKSIAREPGARSKVAVAALQPGADPVGACVGMRGVRIQSIVKELNGEKIDVIEWNSDQSVFISKALSPARVAGVFLDDDPIGGRTATVVVPDDQLSLAIGREGQNARLAAKLTAWRIDIKSVTEAAGDVYTTLLDDPASAQFVAERSDMFEQIQHILEKKESGRPIMPEDYHSLTDFVKLAEGHRHTIREADRVELRQQIAEVRENVPAAAYEHPLEDTSLPLRVYNILDEAGYSTVGQLMEQYYIDPDRLLALAGFGPSALDDVKALVETVTYEEAVVEPAVETPDVATAAVADHEEVELVAEPAQVVSEAQQQELEDDEDYDRAAREALIAGLRGAVPATGEEAEPEVEAEFETELEAEFQAGSKLPTADEVGEQPEEFEDLYEYDDMSDEEREELQRRKAKQRRRQLVFDENSGRMIAKRRRKSTRDKENWIDEWDSNR